jgi:hypothetical protein
MTKILLAILFTVFCTCSYASNPLSGIAETDKQLHFTCSYIGTDIAYSMGLNEIQALGLILFVSYKKSTQMINLTAKT